MSRLQIISDVKISYLCRASDWLDDQIPAGSKVFGKTGMTAHVDFILCLYSEQCSYSICNGVCV